MQTVALPNNDMIKYLLNFIRYDIPILMAGKSSIGKSYTILELTKQWGIPNSVLYVGSEKADNIEGLPKLMDERAVANENVLTYFKPYWFPQSQKIQKVVERGQEIFDKKIKPNFKDKESVNLHYDVVMGLIYAIGNLKFEGNRTSQEFDFIDTTRFIYPDRDNVIVEKKIALTRELVPKGEDFINFRNELYELSLYLCTLTGLGNYWLILDELDKVQPEEGDKFAPMLHIVRERRLKNYSLREFNDGAGADVSMNVVKGSYQKLYSMIKDSLANGQSVLDTRIIAVSNQTTNIQDISDALFKRFVQVVIADILVLRPVKKELADIRSCLVAIETKIGHEQGDLEVGYLREINLQWQFGFLPRLLQSNDITGNFFRNDYLEKTAAAATITNELERTRKIEKLEKTTALWKLCMDNFDPEDKVETTDEGGSAVQLTIPELVFSCISSRFKVGGVKDESAASENPMDLINEFLKKGLSEKDAAMEVYDLLNKKLESIPTGESRTMEIEKLDDYAFSFITNSAYSDGYTPAKTKSKEPYSPLPINEFLIPVINKFIIKSVTKDSIISFDDKDRLMSHFAELWDNFAVSEHIALIKGNPELTQDFFYGGEDSLWGNSDLNPEDFQKSFINSYSVANIELFNEFIKAYIEMDGEKRKEFDDFIAYIRKYRTDDIIEVKKREVEVLKKQKKALEVSKLMSTYKTLFGV